MLAVCIIVDKYYKTVLFIMFSFIYNYVTELGMYDNYMALWYMHAFIVMESNVPLPLKYHGFISRAGQAKHETCFLIAYI